MNPLHGLHEAADATYLPYGPADTAVQVVDTFGYYELEYAAIRRRVGVLDMPQRGVVELRGSDRLLVLHNLLTNEMKSLQPGQARRAFLLNQKGRIVADMVVLHEAHRTVLVLDVFQAAQVAGEIDRLIFTEDVQVADVSNTLHVLALHGPGGQAALAELAGTAAGAFADWPNMTHRTLALAEGQVTVYRRDETGTPGLHLLAPADKVAAIYQRLMAVLHYDPKQEQDAAVTSQRRGRPVGWLAYNTARIEAGTPIFRIDFGTDSLPAETGVLHDAVCFTKGCYLGQEVVARMQYLGHPKRVLVGLRFADDRMPVAGTPVRAAKADEVVGAVTSSTVSPILGNLAIAFAVMKWGSHEPGTQVIVPAEGQNVTGTVQGLKFVEG